MIYPIAIAVILASTVISAPLALVLIGTGLAVAVIVKGGAK